MDNDVSRYGSRKNVSSHFIYASSGGHELKLTRFVARIFISEEESERHYLMKVRFVIYCKIENHQSTFKLVNIDTSEPKALCPTFTCTVDKMSRSIKFGPKGMLGMLGTEIQNRGLGGYCFSLLVQSLCEKGFIDYSVLPIALSFQDAKDEVSTLNRNNFYKSRGFDIDDIRLKHGTISVECLSQLSTNWNRKKIIPISNEYIFKFSVMRQNDVSDLTKSFTDAKKSKECFSGKLASEKEKTNLYKLVIMSLACVTAVLHGGFFTVFSVISFSGLLTLIMLNFGTLENIIRKIKTNIQTER